MEEKEAMYWVAMMQQAQQGDKEAQEVINQTNKVRAANNLPTIQEELAAFIRRKEIEDYKKSVMEEFKKHM